jgi:hypothetical protein
VVHSALHPKGTGGKATGGGREDENSPPSSAEVKIAWSYTSIPPILNGVVLNQAINALSLQLFPVHLSLNHHLIFIKVKVKLSLCFNWAPHHEDVLGSGGIAPLILWPRHYMEVGDQFHAPAALPPGKEPLVPIDRRLGGPQSRSGRCGEEKNSEPLPRIEP